MSNSAQAVKDKLKNISKTIKRTRKVVKLKI